MPNDTEIARGSRGAQDGEDSAPALLGLVSDAVLVLGADAAVRHANPAVGRLLGLGPRELRGRSVLDLAHPTDAQRVSEAFARILREPGSSVFLKLRFRHEDGSWRHAEGTIGNLLEEPGVRGVVLSLRDVTGRVRADEDIWRPKEPIGGAVGTTQRAGKKAGTPALRRSEDRLRSLVTEASEIFWTTNAAGEVGTALPAWQSYTGQSEEDTRGHGWLEAIHPDDREEAKTAWRPAGEAGVSGPFERECRIRGRDGVYRLFVARGVPVVGEGGRVREWVGTYTDVTDRRRAERALGQSEELYRTVVEQAAENISLVDVETGRLLEANAAFRRSLGYGAEELRRLTLYDIFAHDRESVERDIRLVVEEKGSRSLGERRYRRKDGSLADVEVSVSGVIPYGSKRIVCVLAHDVTERKRTERELQRSLDALLAIYEAGHILGSTLEAEEIGSRLLQLMQRISSSVTAVISVPDDEDRQRLRVWHAVGFENLWRRARYTPEVQATLRAVMESGEHAISWLRPPESNVEPLIALFLPLRIRNHSVGVLEVYGPDAMTEKDLVDILLNLTTKAASALENAQLYGKLAERERQLQELVGKLIATQEEERRRVAYEVHDGPTQVAVATFQHLQAFARIHHPATPEGQKALEGAIELARRTVGESRQIIANLRPTVLDDFGLATAIRLEIEALRATGLQACYEETLGNARLPNPVESALYRVAQEALTNVRKHARTERVRVRLRRLRGGVVRLQVRDWGVGIGAGPSQTRGPGERVGLAGMRERVTMVGGRLEVHSKGGVGTLVTADVPLLEGEEPGAGGVDLAQRTDLWLERERAGSPGG